MSEEGAEATAETTTDTEGAEETPEVSDVDAGRRNYVYNAVQGDDEQAKQIPFTKGDWQASAQQKDSTTALYDQDGVHRLTLGDGSIRAEQGYTNDGAVVAETAAQSGWQSIVVDGDDAFRQSTFVEGSARGLDVQGYQPTEQDRQAATDRAQVMRSNETERSGDAATLDRAQAVRDLESSELAAQYPELTKEAGVVQAAQVFADEKIEHADDRDQFMNGIREQVAERVEHGQEVGQINVREERAVERETERAAEETAER